MMEITLNRGEFVSLSFSLVPICFSIQFRGGSLHNLTGFCLFVWCCVFLFLEPVGWLAGIRFCLFNVLPAFRLLGPWQKQMKPGPLLTGLVYLLELPRLIKGAPGAF
jgi:hypothetical protein